MPAVRMRAMHGSPVKEHGQKVKLHEELLNMHDCTHAVVERGRKAGATCMLLHADALRVHIMQAENSLA